MAHLVKNEPLMRWTLQTLGDFTFWLSPWLSLLAETKH